MVNKRFQGHFQGYDGIASILAAQLILGFHEWGIRRRKDMTTDDLMRDDLIRFIPLTKGKIAVVDFWAYGEIMALGPWCFGKAYAVHDTWAGLPRFLWMHRVVLELAGCDLTGLEVDHANGDKLDNRLPNLRPATHSQNQANRGPCKSCKSGFKGVSRGRGKWIAAMTLNRQTRYLGCFACPLEAARAYDRAALEVFGHFAYLNFPPVLPYEYMGPPRIIR